MKNDVKGMYGANLGRTQIVGLDTSFDEPRTPDLVLEVDAMNEEDTFKAVVEYIVTKYGKEFAYES